MSEHGRPTAKAMLPESERLIGMIEADLKRERDPTMRDVLETQRDEALDMQIRIAGAGRARGW